MLTSRWDDELQPHPWLMPGGQEKYGCGTLFSSGHGLWGRTSDEKGLRCHVGEEGCYFLVFWSEHGFAFFFF